MNENDQEKIRNLAVFIRQLIDAGMAIEEAVNHGFNYAMEKDAPETERMEQAAMWLEEAATQVGIHRNQQKAVREASATRLSRLYGGGRF